MSNNILTNPSIEAVESFNEVQQKDVKHLQSLVFGDINAQEIEEDFYHPISAHLLAHIEEELVGWAGIHQTQQEFEGIMIRIGGYGICTHKDFRQLGIAHKVSQDALNFLKDNGCQVGFLSIDPSNTASINLHQKNGFILLPQKFSWTNSKGQIKQDRGGMIAPINSQPIFEQIIHSKNTLYVGNGYW